LDCAGYDACNRSGYYIKMSADTLINVVEYGAWTLGFFFALSYGVAWVVSIMCSYQDWKNNDRD